MILHKDFIINILLKEKLFFHNQWTTQKNACYFLLLGRGRLKSLGWGVICGTPTTCVIVPNIVGKL